MCLGVVINLRPLDKREISSLDKWRLDKLIMLGLTNLPSYLPFNTVTVFQRWMVMRFLQSYFVRVFKYIYIYIDI